MGHEEGAFRPSENRIEKMYRNLFDFEYVIGTGGFGQVINIQYI